MPFVVIGVLGLLWVVPWLSTVWRVDLEPSKKEVTPPSLGPKRPYLVLSVSVICVSLLWRFYFRDLLPNWTRFPFIVIGTLCGLFVARLVTTWLYDRNDPMLLLMRRYLALVVVVISINMLWQFFRAWLPKMLEQYHGYTAAQVRWFIVAYYIATDVGCICAGVAGKWLANRGMSVHWARMTTFIFCTALTSLSVIAAQLPKGPLLLTLFLLIGFGALGLFPNYYSFAQDLSERHLGRISGTLGFITWVVSSEMQERVGKVVDETQSYKDAIFWIGLTPVAGLLAMLLLWGKAKPNASTIGERT